MSASVTMSSPPAKPQNEWPWHPCAACWGQGRVYEMGGLMRDSESGATQRLYFGKDCPACMGLGSVPENFEPRETYVVRHEEDPDG